MKTIPTELTHLTRLALTEYANARRLLAGDADEAELEFLNASEHALHAGMVAGENALPGDDVIRTHVGLRHDFERGQQLGREIAKLQ